ncbi:hypothetical protein G7K_2378-t1 [Saitoella complicata NRRL Y-17804]|uniref:Uncharacterized protein n=1 Tax=Saitoella complicata (strain BCRC 22490 / CBS 7301 / JCM 7358 / NBRC 10748 / NRRL Y-17804) TaxID=698492 RepID=A0A0E9NEG0_SAICN|nr:hypothetical protein G7K_2378-t1 [Saitoella complicata NRRL Y-17804]
MAIEFLELNSKEYVNPKIWSSSPVRFGSHARDWIECAAFIMWPVLPGKSSSTDRDWKGDSSSEDCVHGSCSNSPISTSAVDNIAISCANVSSSGHDTLGQSLSLSAQSS